MSLSSPALWMLLMALALIGQALELRRLAVSGLWRQYRAFAVWSLASAIKTGTLLYVAAGHGFAAREYISAWQPLERVTVACLLVVGWEAYRLTVRNYPAPGKYGTKTLSLSVVIALVIALLPFAMNGTLMRWHNQTWIVAVLIRTATLTVGVGLVIAVRTFRSVPIPEPRNLKNHRDLIILYCAGQAVGMTNLVLTHDIRWVTFHLTVTATCWLLWSFAVTADGEALHRRTYSDGDRANLRERLADIRRWLGRTTVVPPPSQEA